MARGPALDFVSQNGLLGVRGVFGGEEPISDGNAVSRGHPALKTRLSRALNSNSLVTYW